jgi:glycine hydroxymethyltransferase
MPAMLARVLRPRLQPCSRRLISVQAQALNDSLANQDAELNAIVEREKGRQRKTIVLIASENFTSKAGMEAVGSVMTNKYSEGYPGQRYYGGNEFIDQAENLCRDRALETYGLSSSEWGVNVQPLSGSPANFFVYSAVLEPHARMMALDLPHGGHLSHGFQTDKKKVSMVSKYFEVLPYRLNEKTGYIDMDEVEMFARRYRPKLLVCGASAYSRHMDYAHFRKIADEIGALLLCDMAHISGLVAGGAHPSPFPHVDIVTTTTHKSLRGPRGSMIFFRKGEKGKDEKGNPILYDLENRINESVFPGHQGGPHNHTIAGLAVALKQAQSSQFKEYQAQVVKNSIALCEALKGLGHTILSDGTDNHLVLINLKAKGVNGAKAETICDLVNIATNKNTVPGDKSALNPSGLRLGAPAMTSRGLMEKDFQQVAHFVDRAVLIAAKLQDQGYKKKAEFAAAAANDIDGDIASLRREVEAFCETFETIGQ